MVVWLIAGLIYWQVYEREFSGTARVFPELGVCRSFVYGNTVLGFERSAECVRLLFSPVPAASRLGGGVTFENLFTLSGVAADFPLEGATQVHLRVRGKRGDEKFELKLKNRLGEGWCVVGEDTPRLTTEFQNIVIPLGKFERSDRSSMGVSFNHSDGLNAVVFGVGSSLDTSNATEIQVADLHISTGVRHDWVWCGLLFLLVFGASGFARLTYIRRTHFRAFISYADEDRKTATDLARELQGRSIDTWLAPSNLEPGHVFTEQIALGIRRSRYFLLLASADSSTSQFVGIEIGTRITKERWYLFGLDVLLGFPPLDKRNVFVVVVGDNQNSVPAVFAEHQLVSLSGRTTAEVAEMIAAVIYSGRGYVPGPRRNGKRHADGE